MRMKCFILIERGRFVRYPIRYSSFLKRYDIGTFIVC